MRGTALFALTLAASAVVGSTKTATAQERSWHGTARMQVEFRYDDNPFLLTASRKTRLEQALPEDSQSGRFRDMESATDLLPAPALELGLEGPALGGRPLELSAAAAYEANRENGRRRHAELELTIAQSLRRGGRLRFNAEWRPRYFHKNYLRDAVDLNVDGDIGPEERRYEAGTSNEADVRLGYGHRLLKAVRAELEVGYFDLAYHAPFEGRSRRGPEGGVDLSLDLGRRWTIDLGYTYASLAADPAPEVLILDESAFGVDFNGNGSASDSSARAVVTVDRSRAEQEVSVTLEGELGRAATLELSFEHRRRSFSSAELYDVVNRDRRDTRNEIAAELDVRIASGLHLMLGARRGVQTTNRAGDPGSTGEETDYTRHVVFAGLRSRF